MTEEYNIHVVEFEDNQNVCELKCTADDVTSARLILAALRSYFVCGKETDEDYIRVKVNGKSAYVTEEGDAFVAL